MKTGDRKNWRGKVLIFVENIVENKLYVAYNIFTGFSAGSDGER